MLGVPCRLACGELVGAELVSQELVSQEQDETDEAEETRRRRVNRARPPLALRLEPEVGARLLEGDFDLPPTHIPGNNLES
jgi:hypothetical protein